MSQKLSIMMLFLQGSFHSSLQINSKSSSVLATRFLTVKHLLLFHRSLLTQEGICLTLDPQFRFLEVAYPYVARRLLTDEDPALRERLIQVQPFLART